MSVWIGMTGGMDKHWGEKELPRVGHQLASWSLLICYICCYVMCCVCVVSDGRLWLCDTIESSNAGGVKFQPAVCGDQRLDCLGSFKEDQGWVLYDLVLGA